MVAMGYTNDSVGLTYLLESVDADVAKALDIAYDDEYFIDK